MSLPRPKWGFIQGAFDVLEASRGKEMSVAAVHKLYKASDAGQIMPATQKQIRKALYNLRGRGLAVQTRKGKNISFRIATDDEFFGRDTILPAYEPMASEKVVHRGSLKVLGSLLTHGLSGTIGFIAGYLTCV